MTLLLSREDVQVHHADWRELAAALPRREDGTVCDLLAVDAPYSAKTHAGHDWIDDPVRRERLRRGSTHGGGGNRRPLNYAPWSSDDVSLFVETWAPLTRGWVVSITDHVLSSPWSESLAKSGRLGFAPLPYVHVGGRVRLSGDGPSSWTCWVVVARPRSGNGFPHWGTLPGAYWLHGSHDPHAVVGGKPLSVMRALVRDYSRPGDVVCDPCAGAGTTGLAAKLEGRSFIGGDSCLEHAEIAAERLRDVPTAEKAGTLALFREVG